ncbi:ABC transporter ATP-binding protein [Alicyclobacillus fastidiosus]|uniref:ABC transporter ATP-binding protein n=2 Tax=Alicyclobacillus fastidiosus TaxID=392011 RepID=A0ABY6ZDR8_9BACL|nr:ABC transporter ATP-binding protein [Alicyclobacillus fastidiosus]WAH40996.1 ABC transporter ATP-binding protein [Alicyclobacillus fastidiosus]GMA62511.1 putative ABC transporter ATP-binding protein YlmA [Alicyclobacillus fastidiosus]
MNAIECRDVTWVRNRKEILQNVQWTVEPGQHWAILGLNGSGKTSLLNLINGYQWATRGSIQVLGETFGKTDLQALRRRIGWVSNAMADRFSTDRPTDTALEVVMSGKYASVGLWTPIDQMEDEPAALQCLEQVRAVHLKDSVFNVLSQGEKQRVLIARAMMSQLGLFILDEPCTGLDILARESLLETIESSTRQPEGPTILYVTHHTEEIVPGITHVLLLSRGRVVAAGPKRDTLTSANLSRTFGLDVSVEWKQDRAWLQVETTLTVPSRASV